jgi:hypothetical protein
MINPTLHDAVRASYSNAVTIVGNEVNDLSVVDADGNAITIDPSVVTAKLATLESQYAEQQQAQANAKASALAKLTALGLTQAEVTALIGA